MESQQNLNIKGNKIERHQRKHFTVLVQYAQDWEGPCYHLHLELKEPFSKSTYKEIKDTFIKMQEIYYDAPLKTVIETDEKQARLAEHMGFKYIAKLAHGFHYYQWEG